MANKPVPEQDKTTGRFVSGNIGGGRPRGARALLGEQFLAAMQEDFQEHGVVAIAEVRENKPDAYLKVIASLMPKDLNINVNKFDEMTDEQLVSKLRSLQGTIGHFLGEGNSGNTGRINPETKH